MNCEKCNNLLPDSATFCNKCGDPTIAPQKNNFEVCKKIEKWKKNIKNTGTSIYAVGWLSIFISVFMLAWSIFDKNFSEYDLPNFGFSGTVTMCSFGFILIVLGNRIRSLKDIKIKKYLLVTLFLILAFSVSTILEGGGIGIIIILLFFYLLSSLSAINNLMKESQFTATLGNPKYKIGKVGWIIFIVVMVFFSFIAQVIDLSMGNVDKSPQTNINSSI
jgi:hypothetical protein